MINITHYEVYIDKGAGWQLEERFAVDQRYDAINLAKTREAEKLKVKIIKEIFDVQDNSYQETVEYVSNLGGIARNIGEAQPIGKFEAAPRGKAQAETVAGLSLPGIFRAILKLILIIILCLVFANILITLLSPLIKNFVPEEILRPVLFTAFFILFLSVAIPLILKKVPWYVFVEKSVIRPEIEEQKYLNKAEAIYKLYNLNDDFDPSVTPVFPEAPFEYKQYIISFLQQLLSNLDSKSSFIDSFSRLGVKLLVYGGCLELSRNCGLKIPEANSLLFEAFKILDGDNADLAVFYEAKKTYQDNKTAIFLSGIGAYLMARVMNGQPIDEKVLQAGFKKWEGLNTAFNEKVAEQEADAETIAFPCIVAIKSDLHLLADSDSEEETSEKISTEIHNIVQSLLNKYKGATAAENAGMTVINFAQLNKAIHFAVNFLKDIAIYQDEINNEDTQLKNMCVIVGEKEDNAAPDFLSGILEHAFDGEILLTSSVLGELLGCDYKTEYLGEKKLRDTGRSEEIYKLLY